MAKYYRQRVCVCVLMSCLIWTWLRVRSSESICPAFVVETGGALQQTTQLRFFVRGGRTPCAHCTHATQACVSSARTTNFAEVIEFYGLRVHIACITTECVYSNLKKITTSIPGWVGIAPSLTPPFQWPVLSFRFRFSFSFVCFSSWRAHSFSGLHHPGEH